MVVERFGWSASNWIIMDTHVWEIQAKLQVCFPALGPFKGHISDTWIQGLGQVRHWTSNPDPVGSVSNTLAMLRYPEHCHSKVHQESDGCFLTVCSVAIRSQCL